MKKRFLRGQFILLTLTTVLAITNISCASKEYKSFAEAEQLLNKRFPEIESRSLAYPIDKVAYDNYKASFKNDIPHLKITIDQEQFAILNAKRNKALNEGFLFTESDDYIPARIRYNDKIIRVKIRLKGDFTDHLKTDKWSFRVKVRGDDHLFGMEYFSLQAPFTKYFHHEALYMDHLRREGLLAIDYFFVDVTLNDKPIGIMAVEEHFAKELLEAQQSREGAIVCYDEDHFWHSFRRMRQVGSQIGWNNYLPKIFDNWKVAWVRPFRKKRTRKNENLSNQYKYAASVLSGMAFGNVPPSDVFDVEKMGRFMAIADLWGVWHPIRWHNMRFYVNPITMKLEPVGFDANIDETWRKVPFIHKEVDIWYWQDLIKDPALQQAYRDNYKRMLSEDYLNSFQGFIEEKEAEYLQVLYREYPSLPKFDFSTIRSKQEFLSRDYPNQYASAPFQKMEFTDVEFPPHVTAVYAYVYKDNGKNYLELINPLADDVMVSGLELVTPTGTKMGISSIASPVRLQANFHRVNHNMDSPLPVSSIFVLPGSFNPNEDIIQGKAKVVGQGLEYTFQSKPYAAKATKAMFAYTDKLDEVLARYPFIQWQKSRYMIKKGEYIINQAVELAPVLQLSDGTTVRSPELIIEAGTHLYFDSTAYLKINSALIAKGTLNEKIILTGIDKATWKGLIVSEASDKSILEHVEISNTNYTQRGPWKLTGGITFYKSDVSLNNISFFNCVAEDALNIVSSTFDATNIIISGAENDAFDCDFSTGTVNNISIRDIRGDGIDISGSTLEVHNSKLYGINDKALSIGEASTFKGHDISISHVSVGVACKDASLVELNNSKISNVSFGALLAFNKKPVYGPSSLYFNNSEIENATENYICQDKHLIVVDGEEIPATDFNMSEEYKSGFMKK